MSKRVALLLAAITIYAISIGPCRQAPSIEIIARGALIKGAFGINIDSGDRLYIAGFREIVVMDPDSGSHRETEK